MLKTYTSYILFYFFLNFHFHLWFL